MMDLLYAIVGDTRTALGVALLVAALVSMFPGYVRYRAEQRMIDRLQAAAKPERDDPAGHDGTAGPVLRGKVTVARRYS